MQNRRVGPPAGQQADPQDLLRPPHGHTARLVHEALRPTHPGATTHLAAAEQGWDPLLEPGLHLVSGPKSVLRPFHHLLAHHTITHHDGHVLWCDAAHAFDPYEYAELNLTAGLEADFGAPRMLIKRCMTPFQWDSVLTQHLDQKLMTVDTSLVLAAPYDALFSTDELQDWEQEDYVRYSIRHLKNLTRRYQIPILVSVDMARWWHTHPVLAQTTYEAVHGRWSVTHPNGRFRAVRQETGLAVDPAFREEVTLWDFCEVDAAPVVDGT